MRVTRVTRAMVGVVLLVAACRGKTAPSTEGAVPSVPPVPGDTQAQPVAVPAPPPTIGPSTPSRPGVPAPAPSAPGAAGATKAPTKAPSPYIGYDSAFGPSFELDSTGKPVPIKTKKPGGM